MTFLPLLLLYTVCGLLNCVRATACITDLYGIRCPAMCNKNCAYPGICSPITGECEKGCTVGWRGLTCEERCPEGTFGVNCSEMCGYCLNNEPCHYIYGTCLTGCKIGFRGFQCKHACTDSHYGYGCLKLCSSNCAVSGKCDPVTGECIEGCQAGWKGPMCDQIYEQDSFSVPESRSHPTVLIFVFVALFCVSFIITIALLIGIRKTRMEKKQEMQEKVDNKWEERGKYPFTI